jgi:lysophospholipase L1-like esterase
VIGRYDADLGWTLTPGAAARVLADGADYDVALNTRGFRDGERGAKMPGRPRIVLLGDSFGFGFGVAADETFGALLERDPRVGAEVVNLCVPGYSTDQELWMLEREGASLAPDVILLQFCPNDVEGVRTTNSHARLKPRFYRDAGGVWAVENRPTPRFLSIQEPPLSWGDRSLSWSATWQVASGRTPLVASRESPRAASGADALRREPFGRESVLRHAFELLVVRCKEMNAKLVVFGVPELSSPAAKPVVIDGSEYLYDLNQGLALLGRDLGFATVSVDRAFHDADAAGVVVALPDAHWNREGHRLAAEALAPQLARHLSR